MTILIEFEDIFQYVYGLPPKRDIDFTIDLVPREVLASKAPYKMSTPWLREMQMQLKNCKRTGTSSLEFHLGDLQHYSQTINIVH